MVNEDGLKGVTVNPTIFEKAIAGSEDYDDVLAGVLKDNPHMGARALYEKLAVEDVQMAADVLRPVYDETDGRDGFVSLELSPSLANDTEGSIKEARYFWELVNRPNLMIKVPATSEGYPAVEALIAEGINVNVTLMFSLSHYEAVASAYINGLEKCKEPSRVASVASFFISRVDTIVDKALEENGSPEALEVRGKIGVGNSKMAYQRFKEVFSGERWDKLAKRGARVQRVLWASTSTKNPEYPELLYIEELIGKDTVNTIPPATLNAFRDHGHARASLDEGVEDAGAWIKKLGGLDIDLGALTEKLQIDGLASFSNSYDKLISALEEKRDAILKGRVERQVLKIGDYQSSVDEHLKTWKEAGFNRRLWEKDPTLWFSEPVPEITNRLGWLNLPEIMHEQLDALTAFAEEIKNDGIKHVVVLGMGGSSLAPEVYQNTLGNSASYPELLVLDSTHPDAVRAIEEKIDLRTTLFIVASKSGTTLEPLTFFKYFWNKMEEAVDDLGQHFIAITDPKTPLVQLAREKGFRRVFLAPSDLGGRYSALTVFGLVPAALMGADVHRILDRAWVAAEGCAFCVSEQKTPGLALGAALGVLANSGRDKVTFLTSSSLKSFPNWTEQLIAESTGKDDTGILPVVNEPLAEPAALGDDRFFVYFNIEGEEDEDLNNIVEKLEANGHPVAYINLTDKYDIGLEIFRWEIATASAGAVLGIHPFNQPDVESAKVLAREAMEKKGTDATDKIETISVEAQDGLSKAMDDWLAKADKGDYVAIQAYLSPTKETAEMLQKIRTELLNRWGLATTVGYGPRFLHSTGQLHKGGPNNGLFLQIIDEPAEDLSVPDAEYTFGEVIRAQGIGDYQALKKRGRRVLRVNLEKDVSGGLSMIYRLLGKD